MIVKPWKVSVSGFPCHTYYAASRGKALAKACSDFQSYRDDYTFKDFLKIARCWREVGHDRFGEEITVAGLPAYLVSYNRQYIQFVRPDSDVILNSHPLDVEPPEARRGTPYYQPDAPA